MIEHNLSIDSPSDLIIARSEAFARGDFGFIFDTYHSESNFRRQFSDRDEYLEFGKASLGADYEITRCQILQEQESADEGQVIFLMEMKVQGAVQQYVELAWLHREEKSWRYHRGQKLTQDEFPEEPHSLSFDDFAKLDPSTIF
ncbi:YchJ family metal-binding protein [Thermodesulfobacteriota bacterium]